MVGCEEITDAFAKKESLWQKPTLAVCLDMPPEVNAQVKATFTSTLRINPREEVKL